MHARRQAATSREAPVADKLLRIRVTLKGRPVRAFAFTKECITVGRNPESDIFLDNPGISRDHCKLEMTPSGLYLLHDLNSANGVFVNDVQVTRQPIMNNDVMRIGKYSLWVTYEEERRNESEISRRRAGGVVEGTTVLSTTELREMIESVRQAEATAPPAIPVAPAAVPEKDAAYRLVSYVVLAVLTGFLAGYGVGAGVPASVWQSALRPVVAMVTPAAK